MKFKKGHTSWNKGLTKETDERIRKMSEAHIGLFAGKKHPLYGTHRSEETRRKIGESQIGRIPWNKGKKGLQHPSVETRRKISKKLEGIKRSKKTRIKMSKAQKGKGKGRKLSKITRMKMGKSRTGKKNPMYGKPSIYLGKPRIKKIRIKISATKQGVSLNEWKEFISFKPYTLDFNKTFREAIRKRDNYCCMICNKLEKEMKRKLVIHHIDYNKLNSFPQNCITLCNSCHSKTHINRTQWATFFQSLLKEKYGYQYTEDQKIILDFVEA